MFDRFYVQPVCAPTRAEMLTGRYHPHAGVRGVSTGLERMNLARSRSPKCCAPSATAPA